MLSQLRELEREFAGELVIVGVHAGKFTAERKTENIRQAVLRLEVEHPVVNDRAFRIWREYAVSAWPTLVLINPEGRVLDTHPGEISAEGYRPAVAAVVDEFARRGTLDRQPRRFVPEAAAEPPRPLAFPSKVLADGQRLFIADSGHHRIVVVSLAAGGAAGTVEAIAGSGEPGLTDGSFAGARFNHPQGMVLQEDVLYVADTDNHAIRALDLARHQVTTIAGTGEPTHTFRPAASARQVRLSSPWDLAIAGRELYIAMAGVHQLWRLDLEAGDIQLYAGSRIEEILDGPRGQAALAQPSGASVAGSRLYFVDAESSSARFADLAADTGVHTLVGTGLFDFGDRDGVADEVELQHPLGLAWHNGLLYVADTYNNKIKTIDPQTRRAQTFLGSGEPGLSDGLEPRFDEPGGLSPAGDTLYIADTNNHAIRVAGLATKEVSTLRIEGL